MNKRKNYIRLLVLIAVIPSLAACAEVIGFKAMTAGLTAAAHGVFSNPDVNLKAKNYAAADYLVDRMGERVSKDHAILVLPLEEVDHPGITSPLGYAVAEGVGLRLNDLGYNMQLHEVAHGANEGLYPRSSEVPRYLLKGSYKATNKFVAVYLRLVDMPEEDVEAHFDYNMIATSEVRKLAQTPTRIYRVYDKQVYEERESAVDTGVVKP